MKTSRLSDPQVLTILRLDFISDTANAVFIGPNGISKSTLAPDMAYHAVMNGYTALFAKAGHSHHRHRETSIERSHARLRRTVHRSRKLEAGSNPLPQTPHWPRSIRHHYATAQRDQPKLNRHLTLRRASRDRSSHPSTSPLCCRTSRSSSRWKARALGGTMSSSSGYRIKCEEVYLHAYKAVSEARSCIGRYLNFYNSRHPHSPLDRPTPDQAYFHARPPIMVAA